MLESNLVFGARILLSCCFSLSSKRQRRLKSSLAFCKKKKTPTRACFQNIVRAVQEKKNLFENTGTDAFSSPRRHTAEIGLWGNCYIPSQEDLPVTRPQKNKRLYQMCDNHTFGRGRGKPDQTCDPQGTAFPWKSTKTSSINRKKYGQVDTAEPATMCAHITVPFKGIRVDDPWSRHRITELKGTPQGHLV